MPIKNIKFDVETIMHQNQRYPTVGDYIEDEFENTHIRVSWMHDPRYILLVAIHEIIEKYLCDHAGIKEKDITAFDIEYEKNRDINDDTSEPGDHPNAPYNKQHKFATKIEKLIADELGVDWSSYEKAIYDLFIPLVLQNSSH